MDVLKWRWYVLNEQMFSKWIWNNKVVYMWVVFNYVIMNKFILVRENFFNQVIVKFDIK